MLACKRVQRQLTDDSAVAYQALIQSLVPYGRSLSFTLRVSLQNHSISISFHFSLSHLSIVSLGPMLYNKLSSSVSLSTDAHNQIRFASSSGRKD